MPSSSVGPKCSSATGPTAVKVGSSSSRPPRDLAMARWWSCLTLASFLLLLVGGVGLASGQLSNPIAHDSNMEDTGNKFLQRQHDGATNKPYEPPEEDELFDCPQNVELSWMTEVSSSAYSTPLIADLFADGHKEIVVPSFVHYLEVLEASDGAMATGWPAFHKSSVHTSPLMVDIDFDGVQDIAVATYDGEVLFFKDNGEQSAEKLAVPRLRVRKDWHMGLNPDHVDHSHPDVNDPDLGIEATMQDKKLREAVHQGGFQPTAAPRIDGRANPLTSPDIQGAPQQVQEPAMVQEPEIAVQEPPGQEEPQAEAQPQPQTDQQPQEAAEVQAQEEEQQQEAPVIQDVPAVQEAAAAVQEVPAAQEAAAAVQEGQQAPAEENIVPEADAGGQAATARRHLLEEEDKVEEKEDKVEEKEEEEEEQATVENAEELDEEAAKSFKVFEDDYGVDYGNKDEEYENDAGGAGEYGQYEDEYYYEHYGVPFQDERRKKWGEDDLDYTDEFWEDEEYEELHHEFDKDYVMVDAHILCTPTIADLDGDGHDEMIIAVSYFYDREYYDQPDHQNELGKDVDVANYLATGVVVFELHSRTVKWSQHLDLSTDFTKYRAYVYSSPTVVDIDHDGKLEVVVGTSVGFLYVLESDGEPREGWPVQMGEIQAQPVVADFNGDGYMEVFAADTRGNTALFNYKGHELWERHVNGLVAQMATVGDVNGDGQLEIVYGTGAGNLHAVNGRTGQDIPNFPFQAGGRIMAPVLIIKLQDDSPAQHLVVIAFDGLMYMVDGKSGCADTIDIGESSYAMVLADDLDGNGRMDLLASTMNGNIYKFETPSKYHPLKSWTSQNQGRNNFAAKYGYQGIYATEASRAPRDVRGQTLSIRFEIVDERPPAKVPAASVEEEPKSLRGPYTVSVTLQGVGVDDMNMGDQPVIGMIDTFAEPGVYDLEIPCPRTRSTATISIEMTDENKVLFTDSFSLSFHMHFYRLLKWMVLLPFTMMAATILAMNAPSLSADALPFAMPRRTHDA